MSDNAPTPRVSEAIETALDYKDGTGDEQFLRDIVQLARQLERDLAAATVQLQAAQDEIKLLKELQVAASEERHHWHEAYQLCDNKRQAAQRDAERLEWLAAHPREGSIRLTDGTFKECNFWGISAAGNDLRDAIDAAIEQAKEAPRNG